jgi:hypothetical protein
MGQVNDRRAGINGAQAEINVLKLRQMKKKSVVGFFMSASEGLD